jgi:uncharacterized protein involved in exopolysaccharide biosynthesis
MDPVERSPVSAAAVFLRYRLVFAALLAAGTAIGVAFAVVRGIKYTSSTSFVPQQSLGGATNASALSALTGQFGINLGGRDQADSPEYYRELVRSRAVLERLARDTFSIPSAGIQGTLASFHAGDEPNELARVDKTVRWLRNDAIWTGVRRGMVEIQVATTSRDLSREVARRVVSHLTEFNVSSRQARAAAERQFIGSRLEVAQQELRRAEEAMSQFIARNRSFANAPELNFQQQRLQRDISMRQQVVTSMLQQHEQARIDEVRNTPVVTVVDEPNLPAGRDPRRLVFSVVAGAFSGGVIATFLAFALDARARRRPASSIDYRHLEPPRLQKLS